MLAALDKDVAVRLNDMSGRISKLEERFEKFEAVSDACYNKLETMLLEVIKGLKHKV